MALAETLGITALSVAILFLGPSQQATPPFGGTIDDSSGKLEWRSIVTQQQGAGAGFEYERSLKNLDPKLTCRVGWQAAGWRTWLPPNDGKRRNEQKITFKSLIPPKQHPGILTCNGGTGPEAPHDTEIWEPASRQVTAALVKQPLEVVAAVQVAHPSVICSVEISASTRVALEGSEARLEYFMTVQSEPPLPPDVLLRWDSIMSPELLDIGTKDGLLRGGLEASPKRIEFLTFDDKKLRPLKVSTRRPVFLRSQSLRFLLSNGSTIAEFWMPSVAPSSQQSK
jgi:hypothetical protein